MASSRRVYIDHNATTPVAPEVFAAVRPWLEGGVGNPSSIHFAGREARAAVNRARGQVAKLVGAAPSGIVFTSGGSEADNLALLGAVRASAAKERHVVITAVEHPAVLRAADALELEGVAVTRVAPTRSGAVEAGRVIEALRPETVLVSMMLANNETGAVQPVAAVAAAARARGALVHTDAVQGVGRLSVDAPALGVDLLSISGHKFGAPQGTGALYVRRGVNLTPIVLGGGQERGRRAGTENVPGIVGLGAAAELGLRNLAALPPRLAALRDRLERGLLERIPNLRVNEPPSRVCNTLSLLLGGVEGEALLLNLDLEGVAASSGAACSSGTMRASHVLLAMGLSAEEAQGSLRLSLGRTSSDADVDAVLEVLPPIVARLRALSPPRGRERRARVER